MQLSQILEQENTNLLVLYPGRFHPFHKGHYQVYQYLVRKFGRNNVYIVTSDKVDPPKSPFSFSEKKIIMTHVGVDPQHIVQVKNPYRAEELVSKFDPSNTVLAFAVSEKDMQSDPRFQFKPKKDGSPSYFQPYKDANSAETMDKHGYITVVPTFDFSVLDKPARSATQIRAQFASSDADTQKAMIADLFGSYDKTIHDIMSKKITEDINWQRARILNKRSKTGGMKYLLKGNDGVWARQYYRLTDIINDLDRLDKNQSIDQDLKNDIMSKIDTIKTALLNQSNQVSESLVKLDKQNTLASDIRVPGFGTMTLRQAMVDVRKKMMDISQDLQGTSPSEFMMAKSKLDKGLIQLMLASIAEAVDDIRAIKRKGGVTSKSISSEFVEAWSAKYKRSINCKNPKGFSQRAHCAGRKKKK